MNYKIFLIVLDVLESLDVPISGFVMNETCSRQTTTCSRQACSSSNQRGEINIFARSALSVLDR